MSAEPIRSAKDAINAMYASDSPKRLSDYLANPNAKVASNIHHASRPSASSLLRRAKPRPAAQPQPIDGSVDPLARRAEVRAESKAEPSAPVASPAPAPAEPAVVRTSLKLGPKKPPRVTAPRVNTVASSGLHPAKGQNSLNPPAIDQRTVSAMNTIRNAASKAVAKTAAAKSATASDHLAAQPSTPPRPLSRTAPVKPTTTSPRPIQASRSGSIQDIIRPAGAKPFASAQTTASAAPHAVARSVSKPTAQSVSQPAVQPAAKPSAQKPAAAPSPTRPVDSVKNRFRPAPKGYATSAPVAQSAAAYQFPDSQLDPLVAKTAAAKASAAPANDRFDLPAFHATSGESADSAIHIYGMTEGPDESDGWVSPKERRAATDDNLGVIEDYHADPDEPFVPVSQEQVVVGRHPAVDQDRYAPGEQSPFFLKSVQVDKRPLSAAEHAADRTANQAVVSTSEISATSAAPSRLGAAVSRFAAKQPAKNVYQKSAHPSPKVPRPLAQPGSAAKSTESTSAALAGETKSAKTAAKTPKPKKAQKATRAQRAADRAASRPTVIIPASRRSHAPLLLLLVITVLLGAIVGSLAYLFLFQ